MKTQFDKNQKNSGVLPGTPLCRKPKLRNLCAPIKRKDMFCMGVPSVKLLLNDHILDARHSISCLIPSFLPSFNSFIRMHNLDLFRKEKERFFKRMEAKMTRTQLNINKSKIKACRSSRRICTNAWRVINPRVALLLS